jgi:hypothetical protein
MRRAPGCRRGSALVQPVDVGEQHQHVRADHLRHARGQPVVVAVADLLGGDGVVLVDDRHDAELQQRLDGRAGVQPSGGRRSVSSRVSSTWAGGEAFRLQHLLPRAHEQGLAAAAAACFCSSRRAGPEAKASSPEGHRAGGDDQDLHAAPGQLGDVGGDAGQPAPARRAAGGVDQEREADLHHHAPGVAENGGGVELLLRLGEAQGGGSRSRISSEGSSPPRMPGKSRAGPARPSSTSRRTGPRGRIRARGPDPSHP